MKLWSRRQLAARAALLLLAACVGAVLGLVSPVPGVSVWQSILIGIVFGILATTVILIAVRLLQSVIENWNDSGSGE